MEYPWQQLLTSLNENALGCIQSPHKSNLLYNKNDSFTTTRSELRQPVFVIQFLAALASNGPLRSAVWAARVQNLQSPQVAERIPEDADECSRTRFNSTS
jgi:hypothetical protein